MRCLLPVLLGRALGATPVESAITLLENLESQVQTDGAAESTTYEAFACFCKSKQVTTSERIATTKAEIVQLKADVAKEADEANAQKLEIQRLELLGDQYQQELKDALNDRENERAVHIAAMQDVTSAAASVGAAIDAVQEGVNGTATMLLQDSDLAMSHVRANAAGDFHSGDLLGTLESLKSKFETRQTDLETTEAAAMTTFTNRSDTKQDERDAVATELATAKQLRTAAEGAQADNEEDLIEKEAMLESDKEYLATIQKECEAKAKTWDQRSALRDRELTALDQALTLLTGKVQTHHGAAQHGAALVQVEAARAEAEDGESFLELDRPRAHARPKRALDARGRALAMVEQAQDAHPQSPALASVAMHLAMGDPMAKVKMMIQRLIERLVSQATDEAAHKGWCDTEMGMGESERDSRYTGTSELNGEIEELEARQAELENTQNVLRKESVFLDRTLLRALQSRTDEKVENKRVLSEATDGLHALNQVITLLEDFYRPAGRARVFFLQLRVAREQEQVRNQTAIDEMEDVGGGGFDSGEAYQGNQAGAHGVLGALGVVKADFTRTIQTTEAAEEQSARDFQAFEQMTRAAISERKRGLEQTAADLDRTQADLVASVDDLRSTQGLLDKALQLLETLRPGCEYHGMSYDEHVERREAEIHALKTAICLIDGQDDC